MNARFVAPVCAIVALSIACGTLQVSIEGTPGADPAASGTISALQAQNAELGTKAARQITSAGTAGLMSPTSGPGAPLTETPMPATRITFLSGATVGVVSAPIGAGQTQTYVLDVFEAQPMIINVRSASGEVTASVHYEDGSILLAASAHQSAWRSILPKTGDYYVAIHGGAAAENFTLSVTLPLPVHFAPGTESLTISGKTVAGYDVAYDVYASKGQKMNVSVEQISGKGSLAIYGFQDGQEYLRPEAGQKSFDLTLPATQDYIVGVVPFDGLVLDYIVTITVR